jgi:cellulose synthase/poly-beta-1,6-N-acetylglucosamine synthase-like glycosyltransferase
MNVSDLFRLGLEGLSMLYLFAALVLALYALHAYGILAVLARHGGSARRQRQQVEREGRLALDSPAAWPDVVTQLPLYNEANVAERLIRAVAAMDYPGRHTVQVIDDSTDETRALVDAVAEDLRRHGHRIAVVRRADRSGFKAGALAHGMTSTEADYFAVFDADFVPPSDFLIRTLPFFFGDSRAGFVQGRWSFLNERDSVLTRAQGVGLDSHFAIEQCARSSHPAMFMNFNGTAGIWRRAAIEEAGGWSAATLTEDIDLSYRVQLAGWRGWFLPDLLVPGELPPTFAAYKSQQFRWAKGSMQTAIRLLPSIGRSPMSPMAKVEAFFHLTHYAVHPLLFIVIILTPLLAFAGGGAELPGIAGWILLLAAFAPTLFYGTGQALLHRDWPRRLLRLPALTLAGMGLAAANARAIAEAVLGHQSAFIRTPKRGDRETRRYRVKFPVPPAFECALGFYALGGVWFAWQAGHTGIAHFGLLAAASFLYMGGWSLKEMLSQQHVAFTRGARRSAISKTKQPNRTLNCNDHHNQQPCSSFLAHLFMGADGSGPKLAD